MARQREPIAPRIMRTVREDGGCWIWTGCKTKDGYGVLTVGRKQQRAHRASYEAFKGEIPEGQLVCHECDTPLCVNPEHLFLGTPGINTQDMIAKGRKGLVIDTEHPNTKISHAQRDAIRKRRASGEALKTIADQYGVAFQTISGICNGDGSYGTR